MGIYFEWISSPEIFLRQHYMCHKTIDEKGQTLNSCCHIHWLLASTDYGALCFGDKTIYFPFRFSFNRKKKKKKNVV